MPRKPVDCGHGCHGEPIIVKSTVGDAKLLILDDKLKDKQDKLEDVLKSTISIGGIETGKTYAAGTSLEVILRDLLCGSPAPEGQEVYFGGLDYLPVSEEDLQSLTKTTQEVSDMISGVSRNIPADEQYVTIAYKAKLGNINSITEDGFEALSDFSNQFTFGDYKFYCTSDEVYDPDGEINYVIKWGIN